MRARGFTLRRFNPRSHAGSDLTSLDAAFSKIWVSIHAPTRGATRAYRDGYRPKEFQSTLPRGERPSAGNPLKSKRNSFNPRSHAGSDYTSSRIGWNLLTFQSTLPRGERPTPTSRSQRPTRRFQSTLPRGERLCNCVATPCLRVSIHAPTRGATQHIGASTAYSLYIVNSIITVPLLD